MEGLGLISWYLLSTVYGRFRFRVSGIRALHRQVKDGIVCVTSQWKMTAWCAGLGLWVLWIWPQSERSHAVEALNPEA